jgi:hypothetical protein
VLLIADQVVVDWRQWYEFMSYLCLSQYPFQLFSLIFVVSFCRCGQIMSAAAVLRRLLHNVLHYNNRVCSVKCFCIFFFATLPPLVGSNAAKLVFFFALVDVGLVRAGLTSKSKPLNWMASASSCRFGIRPGRYCDLCVLWSFYLN